MSESDLKKILPFTKEYSSKYWEDKICRKRHLQQREKDEWTNNLIKIPYNYIDDWNNNDSANFAGCLSSFVDLPNDETIIFFWSQESGIETTWSVFLRNWINFLFEDEAPILICPRTGFSARFDAAGAIYIGSMNV